MKRSLRSLAIAGALLSVAACGPSSGAGQIGTVDVIRIQNNWPKFLNYQNQLNADAQAIDRSGEGESAKARDRASLGKKYVSLQNELTSEVRGAAQQVANDRHLKLVVTREFVGYGGADITADVEKILKITEAATPTP
ncbi:MAG: hypothetical protein ABI346_00760 [Candidatus Baltobacteraceae bacterium]